MGSQIYSEIAQVVTKGKVRRIVEMLDPRKRIQICETDVQEDTCKSIGKLGTKYDIVKEKIEEMIIRCNKKKEAVTVFVEKLLGLSDVFAFASNDDDFLDFELADRQEFVGDVVKQLIVGSHMDNLVEQDYASQRSFLAQTLDELLADTFDDEISDSDAIQNESRDLSMAFDFENCENLNLAWIFEFQIDENKSWDMAFDFENCENLDLAWIFDSQNDNENPDSTTSISSQNGENVELTLLNDDSHENAAENPKLSIIVHVDGKPIGKIYLHGDQVKLESPTKSFLAKESSSSIVPIPITSEIRKTIRMFPFENFDTDMQHFSTISLSGKIFKLYPLFVDQNELISMQTFKEDTVESVLRRLDSVHSTSERKVIGLYADHKLLKLDTNIWQTVSKYDKLILSLGKTVNDNYSDEPKSIYLQAFDGTQICVDILDEEYSDSFITRITTILEADYFPVNFNYRSRRIETGKLMSDYKVEEDDILHFSLPSVGGKGKLFLSIDLSNVSVTTGVGTHADYGYTYGLNAIGNCKNESCPSQGDIVYHHLGYPEMEIMDAKSNGYQCPRCFEQDINVHTFLMAAGRAKFVFRKIGVEKDQVMFLESPSADHTNYSKFNVNNYMDRGTSVEYDFVRIYTTKFDYSFNKCQGCDRAIHLSEQEVMECGRAFHQNCLKETNGKCPTCELPEMSLEEVQSKVTGNRDDSSAVNLKISNNIYRDCKITYTDKTSIEQGSLNDFVKWMNRNPTVSKRHFSEMLDLQQSFVSQNLDRLIQVTRVNTSLLAVLVSRGVLHRNDESILVSIGSECERAQKTYSIMSQQIDGLKVMYEACNSTNQSGAAAVLTNFILKVKTKFKRLIGKRK